MRPIDADALYDKAETWYKNAPTPFRKIYRSFVDAIADAPTIEPPPNDPLTMEELREINEPVWAECGATPFAPNGGYYCLCQRGNITAPSGSQFYTEEIPHWTFYRRKPKEG